MTERIEVNGVEFDILTERLNSWKAFQIMRDARATEDDYERTSALMEVTCYITGLDESEFIDKCGGADTSIMDVFKFVSEIIKAAYPKN